MRNMRKALTEFAIKRPLIVLGLTLMITFFFAMQFPKINIDTDPQNMLTSSSRPGC